MADDAQHDGVEHDTILTKAAETIGSTLGTATRAVMDGAQAASARQHQPQTRRMPRQPWRRCRRSRGRRGWPGCRVDDAARSSRRRSLAAPCAGVVRRTVKRVQRQVKVTARKARKVVAARGSKKTAAVKRGGEEGRRAGAQSGSRQSGVAAKCISREETRRGPRCQPQRREAALSLIAVPGSGFGVPGSGSGFRVRGSGFRVPGSGFGVPRWRGVAAVVAGSNQAAEDRRANA